MKILEPVPTHIWQDIAEKCPWATYFHTPQWASLIVKTFPTYSVASTGYILNGGPLVVVPCVSREKKGLFRNKKDYKSMEPGVYGGFIAGRDLLQDEIEQIVSHMLKMKNTTGRIVETPFKPLNLSPQLKSKKMWTHIVELGTEFDIVRKKFNRGQKSNLNQAKRKKVAIRQAETQEDIIQYFCIYQQTIKRWSQNTTTTYPRELFLNLFLQRDRHISFWLAEVEGEIVAGIIVLAWNRNLIYWHGSALRDYFKYYPNNLLQAAVMEWGCGNGFTHYDMGPSMGLEGVIKFKESFGAKPYEFKSYRWKQ